MFWEILVRYLHFLGIILTVGALFAELFIVRKQHSRKQLKFLARVDSLYGIAVILAIVMGFVQWFVTGKGAEFYSSNWILWTKVGLVMVIGLLSIKPTVFFIRNQKGDPEEIVQTPNSVIQMIRLEVFLICLVPLLASLMARGIQ